VQLAQKKVRKLNKEWIYIADYAPLIVPKKRVRL
jgi:hypothetical protein